MTSAPNAVLNLVERFDNQLAAYRSGRYKEAHVRHDFIDPLFDALGWDINNRAGYAEAYRDVIHEDAIKVGGATKAPDYCFRVGGRRIFFLEAKKPSVDIAREVHPAYQLRRYAWSAKLPLSVLTDFEEFAVYDCRIRPKPADKAAVARTMYLKFTEYTAKWDQIESIFARQSVLKGSFDKYAQKIRPRGNEVDAEFLKEIEKWRGALARNIALRNPPLKVRDLNFAVQRTIDRIIFLRMAEDRGIETYASLQALIGGQKVYARLMEMFRAADDRYNSGLFHFRRNDPGHTGAPDELTPGLKIDDKVLKDIFKGLYYPDSPYEFAVLPADILGNVYEQFLGKVIRLTKGHQARVEEKPEVKKAGGVYYTPKYIVDYIVKHTVGRLLGVTETAGTAEIAKTAEKDKEITTNNSTAGALSPEGPEDVSGAPALSPEGASELGRGRQPPEPESEEPPAPTGRKNISISSASSATSAVTSPLTPQEIGGLTDKFRPSKARAPLRILDPACGSGSFLVGAYKFLLAYHRDWYLANDPGLSGNEGDPSPATGYRLPATCPGASRADAGSTDTPTLRPTKYADKIYQGMGGQWYLTTAEKKRILLSNIYGVDIDSQAVEVTKLNLLLCMLENENQGTIESQLRMWHERALPDLADNVKCGNSLIGPDFYQGQMSLFDEEARHRINAFDWPAEFPQILGPKAGKNPGFDAVIGNPPWGGLLEEQEKDYLWTKYVNRRGEAESHLFFIERATRVLSNSGVLGLITPNTWLTLRSSAETRQYLLHNTSFTEICELSKYIFRDASDIVPIVVFLRNCPPNANKCVVRRTHETRIHAGNFDDAFFVERIRQDTWTKSPEQVINLRATPAVLRIRRKCLKSSSRLSGVSHVLYGIKTGNNKRYLATARSDRHSVRALKTGEVKRYGLEWKGYYLWWCPELAGYRSSNVAVPKIVVQYIRKLSLPRRIVAALDEHGEFYPLNNYSYIVPTEGERYSLKYILGVVNSALVNFLFANWFVDYNIKPTYLQQLPIRTIDFTDASDKAAHDGMVALVEQMLKLHKALPAAKTAHAKTLLQRQIAATDKQIDQLVYELYGLTEEEIRIVEEATT